MLPRIVRGESGGSWIWLAFAFMALLTVGCGGPVVGAGQASREKKRTPVAIPVVRNASRSIEPASELSDVPHVPATSAVTLPEEPGGEAIYHETKPGDTPAKVARQYRTTTERLLRHNGLNATSDLEPGQLLAIPP